MKLYTKRLKCCFYQEGVQFLKFYIFAKGIAMETPKVQAIKDWPIPKSVNNIQIFLEFANFYQQFIEGFSRIAAPLTEYLKKTAVKEAMFQLLKEAVKAFSSLKEKFQ